MKINKKYNSKGFTFLELLIAIFIIVVGILSISALASFTTKAGRLNKEMLIGAYLAQEGVEIMRGIRDNNFLNDRNFNHGFSTGTCGVDYSSISCVPENQNRFLAIDNTGRYSYSPGSSTNFRRVIEISSVTPTIEFTITVFGKDNRELISVKEILYNWYQP